MKSSNWIAPDVKAGQGKRDGAGSSQRCMDDDARDPEPQKLKLGKKSFEKVNRPTSGPDPNAVHQILAENLQRDSSLDLPQIEQDLRRRRRQQLAKHLKVFLGLGIIDGFCLGISAASHWNPYLIVPLCSAGTMITCATLWIVYVVNR